ncbi:MAG: AI-2E family transporter [Marmoricola sp.]
MARGSRHTPRSWWRSRRSEDAVEEAAREVAREEAREEAREQAERTARATAQRESDERVRQWLSQQWAEIRAARQPAEPRIDAGPSNFAPGQVPYGVDLAAAWAWRFIVITIAGLMILYAVRFFALVVLPLVVALFLAALLLPVVDLLERRARLPRKLASITMVILTLAVVALLLTFVGQQVSSGVDDLSGQVVNGLEQIRDWLRTGPLHASDSQINDFIQNAQDLVKKQGEDITGKAAEVGTAVGHVVAAFFIVLFSSYFFLADGRLIWAWMVRLFPRTARLRADASGRVAFRSLTQFVRATVLVAGTDAIGTMIGAAILGLPFVGAIGVLVFLGAFVPLIGATLSGTVAVLVALVAKGPIVALIMLGVVIAVQQLEAHILQPFLMGRFVSVHPLGVIVAIAMGVVVAGIAGALVAVPLAAALNSVVQYLAEQTRVGEDAEQAAAEDPGPDPALADADRDPAAIDTGGVESLEED